jgi:hypothetical protein
MSEKSFEIQCSMGFLMFVLVCAGLVMLSYRTSPHGRIDNILERLDKIEQRLN